MNKLEFIEKLDSLNLDKNRYCVIAGGMMLLRGLRKETADIDIKIRPDYFDELKTRFDFKKSPKFRIYIILATTSKWPSWIMTTTIRKSLMGVGLSRQKCC